MGGIMGGKRLENRFEDSGYLGSSIAEICMDL